MGYASVINLRPASEPGANVEGEAAAAKRSGINFVHLPFNAAAPDPELVSNVVHERPGVVTRKAVANTNAENTLPPLYAKEYPTDFSQ